MNLYKLVNIKNEQFEVDTYRRFPEVYRYGVPEYQCIPHWVVLVVSVVLYAVSNIWIYIEYNESDDFIICIPKCLNDNWFIPLDKLQIESNDGHTEKNGWILNSGKKVIYRFTFLFSVHFWRFIFSYSMRSRCDVQDNCRKCLVLYI